MDLINARDITMRYDSIVALRDLSLTVRPGELVGLLGPNGAGKTTLMEIIEGVKRPTSGAISVMGETPSNPSNRLRGAMGLVFQRYSLPRHISVTQMIDLCQCMYPTFTAGEELVATLGMAHLRNRIIGELSAGQQQRLCILTALYGFKELVVLDEPTSALDVRSRRAVWAALLNRKKRTGLGGIIATHDMAEATELCDRVYFIEGGQIRANGNTADFVRRGSTPALVLRFKAPDLFMDSFRKVLPVQVEEHRDGDIIELTCPAANAPRLLSDILNAEQEYGFASQVSVMPRSLESTYLNIIAAAD